MLTFDLESYFLNLSVTWPGVVSADGGWPEYYIQLHVIAGIVSLSHYSKWWAVIKY